MIGFLLIYFVGKYFYDLAISYQKNKWTYAVLGVIIYFVSQLIVGIGIGISDEVFKTTILQTVSEWVLNILGIPVGIFAAWLYYKFLEKKWSNKKKLFQDSEILDDDVFTN